MSINKNIILIGFMGAGKSVTAGRLADLLKRELVSTDELIVQREGRTINDIFKDSGESYFRKVEKAVVADVSQNDNLVIDCGGGVILDPDNVSSLRKKGVVFYLAASPEVIYERVKNQRHRPLLKGENPRAKIKELLNSRQPHYQAAAHHTIDTSNKTIEQVVNEVQSLMSHA